MATAQNGWRVLESYGAPLVTNPIPGTNGLRFLGGILAGDVDVVLRYVAYRWHREVEPITGPEASTGQWGYNYRAIRGQSSGFSNHAAGTAIDINSAKHPLGTKTLTSGQKAALQRISADLGGVVRFGAFYSGRPDEMHAEINASAGEVARVANLIRAGRLPNVPGELGGGVIREEDKPAPAPTPAPKPTPAPSPVPKEDDNDMADITEQQMDRIAKKVCDLLMEDRQWRLDPGNPGTVVNLQGVVTETLRRAERAAVASEKAAESVWAAKIGVGYYASDYLITAAGNPPASSGE